MRSRTSVLVSEVLFVFFTCSVPSVVHAWGNEGHKIVCQIAFRELSTDTRSKLQSILGVETFAEACTWPDKQGELQRSRRPEHFINVPRYWSSIWYEECPGADRCLFTAIRADESKLAASSATSEERHTALRFLGHWLGDIHQPLHVSYADDRGGNEIAVKAGLGCSKLHAIWDTCIPRYLMSKTAANDALDYADALQKEITAEERATWTADMAPVTWANESYAVTRESDVEYCTLDGKKCEYSADSEEYDPEQDEMRHLSLSTSYEKKHGSTVEERLKQGGVRLAAILNKALK